ncbi:bacillithiol biosynthesis cysteine-adding enzyme BshC [Bacillus cereus]|uniref:bacillithiol biosynthesis cysteine-adding enzyme BshC n=1 Tax=Bacillus TaxID=1386 RepID=UPI0005507EE7|nr:bacillithiol biosynthesis cysteine-adding enzyme BshC [Bacillus sp. UNC322MFChir4.1]
MEIKEISVPLQGVVADYLKHKKEIQECFDYPVTEESFVRRIQDLRNRQYPRQELVSHLLQYNQELNAGEKTFQNINALLEEDTYVVIGGQQAGLLTGPLYTIHKIISILQLAKEKEASLGVRVVPVFWIAGEDHDIDEINHVFVTKNGKVKKTIFHGRNLNKASASETEISIEDCQHWIEEIFKTYPETKHTKDLLRLVEECLQQSRTYVDFFARFITKLFMHSGLILVDSHHPILRNIEVPFLKELLARYKNVQVALNDQQRILRDLDYKTIIETKPNVVHIFMEINGERLLLEEEEGRFICKEGMYSFSYEEIIKSMEDHPERFSNNVVTRPLMQEYIFPTLAFIGGPGEIAYWSELQQVFHAVDFQMPPVVPRLTISYIERDIETDLQDLQIQESEVFSTGIPALREKWLSKQVEEPIDSHFMNASEQIGAIHTSLQQFVQKVSPGLRDFAKKNELKIMQQLELLERTIQSDLERKHEVQLNKFRRIECSLQPLGAPQERIWNICYYLNVYGLDFVERVMKQTYRWNGKQHIIKL